MALPLIAGAAGAGPAGIAGVPMSAVSKKLGSQLFGAAGKALGALAPAIGGEIATQLSPVARAERQALRADVEKLKTGVGLGLSEAEKRQGVAGAVQAAQAAQAGLIDEARRTGDFSRIAALAHQASQAGAQSRQGLEAASQQLAQQRAENIRARMKQQADTVYARGEKAGERLDAAFKKKTPAKPGLDQEQLADWTKQNTVGTAAAPA